MKLIEGMKRIKSNKEKIADLQTKISQFSAHLSYETPLYPDTTKQVSEWIQSCIDLTQDNAKLLVQIQKTNLATAVTIVFGDKSVTKNIAEWIWRRREYAALDLSTWSRLTDRGLKEGVAPSTAGGEPMKITIVRNFDPIQRDKMMAMYKSEPHEIDSALEVINAVTDLVE